MKLIDLSQPVYDGCPNCPVHPPVKSKIVAVHRRDHWRMEVVTMATHTGSHVDAPLHKLEGTPGVSDFPIETWVGGALIADLRGSKPDLPIDSKLLSRKLPKILKDKIVLLATGWGNKRAKTKEWHFHSPYLSPEGAAWLVEKKIRGVGIDHYSIGGFRDPDNSRTHEILLGAGIWVVEDLKFPGSAFRLKQPVKFWCLPFNLKDHTGSFCRPVIEVS